MARKTAKSAGRSSPGADSDRDLAPDGYLEALGERVRDARARHGMTRRMLARDSGISERYLAQLESGRGNFSILLLRRLANAIDVPLGELVNEEPPLPVEYSVLAERLRHLESGELAEAAAMLTRRFGGMNHRSERIALVGLRGSGKTTLGKLLAENLGWSFVELSREIEKEAGVSVAEIFNFWGQAAYRRYEKRALEKILMSRRRIVTTVGGGLVSDPATFERLLDACYTVWLRASPREHWDRVIRQGDYRLREATEEAAALADMRRILKQREALYGMADAQLDTSGRTIRQSAKELVALVEKRA